MSVRIFCVRSFSTHIFDRQIKTLRPERSCFGERKGRRTSFLSPFLRNQNQIRWNRHCNFASWKKNDQQSWKCLTNVLPLTRSLHDDGQKKSISWQILPLLFNWPVDTANFFYYLLQDIICLCKTQRRQKERDECCSFCLSPNKREQKNERLQLLRNGQVGNLAASIFSALNHVLNGRGRK